MGKSKGSKKSVERLPSNDSRRTSNVFVHTQPDGSVALNVNWDAVGPPANTFSADLAIAEKRISSPTIKFIQVLPGSAHAQRVVSVRYEWPVFVERSRKNRRFLESLRERLEKVSHADSEDLVKQAKAAKVSPQGTQAILFDVDFDFLVNNGETASAIFAKMDCIEKHLALKGHLNRTRLHSLLEVTMPLPVMVGMLDSWMHLSKAWEQ